MKQKLTHVVWHRSLDANRLSQFEKKQSFIFNALGEKGIKVKSDFEYSSDKNDKFLSIIEIKKINKEYYSDPV